MISLCFSSQSFAKNVASNFTTEPLNDSSWKTWKENKNIKVDYQQIEGSDLIEIKAQAAIQSSLAGFLLFIQDTDNITQWLDNAHSSNVLKQISPQENIFITSFKNYWPITERYMVVNSRYWQNEDLTLEIEVHNVEESEYVNNEMIQIEVIKAHWKITPVDRQNINIVYTIIADPKGAIPFWLTKRISLNSLWKTMNNMQKQLPLSPWQKHSLSNIKEHQKK
ncbi:START domain-containing protein [Pseudocolwellia agarivorans]|uniref:START domain-containing protein n=1 Tax=Pseudocolwellia agarivorans TaxID=1911682 RepID=UPI001589CE68|nr:START domain-containing protein [Pseudocolwellia agarivorans]